MSDEQKENRINVGDLPRAEQELTSEESKEVKGGAINGNLQISELTSVSVDPAAPLGHVKVVDGTKL